MSVSPILSKKRQFSCHIQFSYSWKSKQTQKFRFLELKWTKIESLYCANTKFSVNGNPLGRSTATLLRDICSNLYVNAKQVTFFL